MVQGWFRFVQISGSIYVGRRGEVNFWQLMYVTNCDITAIQRNLTVTIVKILLIIICYCYCNSSNYKFCFMTISRNFVTVAPLKTITITYFRSLTAVISYFDSYNYYISAKIADVTIIKLSNIFRQHKYKFAIVSIIWQLSKVLRQ